MSSAPAGKALLSESLAAQYLCGVGPRRAPCGRPRCQNCHRENHRCNCAQNYRISAADADQLRRDYFAQCNRARQPGGRSNARR